MLLVLALDSVFIMIAIGLSASLWLLEVDWNMARSASIEVELEELFPLDELLALESAAWW